jgi:hypothetical protein
VQTRFRSLNVPSNKPREFETLVKNILATLRTEEIQSDITLQELFLNHNILTRQHTRLRRKPEDVTEDNIIEPILSFLVYTKLSRSSGSADEVDRKEADYTLEINGQRILVEAETLNKDLYKSKGEGVIQIKSYLQKRSFRADLGIVTNGLLWILIRYDDKTYNFKELQKVDLALFRYFYRTAEPF